MKRVFILPLLGIFALTACGTASSNTASEQHTTALTAASSVAAVTTAASTEVTTTTSSAATVQSTAAQTTASAITSQTVSSVQTTTLPVQTTGSTFKPAFTISGTTATLLQGGGGGEEHAEDIDPLYFNYLFGEDEAALRLAGGTYQVIGFDFSEALDHEVDSLYYLQDADFDGDYDLCVPVHFANSNVEHAIFRWNAETQHYDEQPVLIINPVFHTEKKQITSLQHVSATKSDMIRYEWADGALKTTETATADFVMLTFVQRGADDNKTVLKFETEAELEKAVNDFLA